MNPARFLAMITPGNRTRHGIFILLRRLRQPLMVLISVYAVAVLGFTLIPGVDPDGQPWTHEFSACVLLRQFSGHHHRTGRDSLSLSATPSACGPRPQSTARWWRGCTPLARLFSVLQDPLFRRILHENGVERAVRRIREPFYLVCGYDDAGSRVARELAEDGARLVVIDIDSRTRWTRSRWTTSPVSVPALTGDASDPKTLVLAGLNEPALRRRAGADRRRRDQHQDCPHRAPAQPRCAGALCGSRSRLPCAHGRGRRQPHHQPLRHLCRAGGHSPSARPVCM